MNAYEMGELSRKARDSDAYFQKRSVQFRKKKEPQLQKPHHIQALDGKVARSRLQLFEMKVGSCMHWKFLYAFCFKVSIYYGT